MIFILNLKNISCFNLVGLYYLTYIIKFNFKKKIKINEIRKTYIKNFFFHSFLSLNELIQYKIKNSFFYLRFFN